MRGVNESSWLRRLFGAPTPPSRRAERVLDPAKLFQQVPADTAPEAVSPKLSVAGPLSEWIVQAVVQDQGYGADVFENHVIFTDTPGQVKVLDSRGKSIFDARLEDEQDLLGFHLALRSVAEPAEFSTLQGGGRLDETLRRNRATGIEQRVNKGIDPRFFATGGSISKKYIQGRPVEIPLVALAPGEGEVLTSKYSLPGKRELRDFFTLPDGRVLYPFHPEEAEKRGISDFYSELGGRCASSERTMHVAVPGNRDFLLKLDLASIKHASVVRPILAEEGESMMRLTDFLSDWANEEAVENDPFCFLPEMVAVVNHAQDAAAIIRSTTPYPPREDGQETWTVPTYSLIAKDPDFPHEGKLAVRMVRNRPDLSVPAREWAAEHILRPMIDAALRVYLDLGSSAQAHGQNSFLELDAAGQPTGRMAFTDLEAFWPHPEVAHHDGKQSYFEKYGLDFKEAKASDIHYNFTSYFWKPNLLQVAKVLGDAVDEPGQSMVAYASQMLHEGVKAREEKVRALSGGALKGFEAYLEPPPPGGYRG